MAKLTTVMFRNRLKHVNSEMMCWEAVLDSFGVKIQHEERGQSIRWILNHLHEAGWNCKPVKLSEIVTSGTTPTLAVILPSLIPRDDWLLILDRHVIAVRDGIITDTAGRDRTVKRSITMIYKLTPTAYPAIRLSCKCADPVVFGHAYRVLSNDFSGVASSYCPELTSAK
jgi:hypothetical protein